MAGNVRFCSVGAFFGAYLQGAFRASPVQEEVEGVSEASRDGGVNVLALLAEVNEL